ncbi:pentatricopeptide repeat-containing protein At2g48000-like [Andrographis paniculata]|uniref:pentatricopeptide repeat-containing protein At2g48000-like n=1 Tax=Andrographis paniculata TaxID=175694 RepID=UPI0021E922D1|nr:pentatricopeptide repeat-containing protein At2g48000-like [Andrographis paniculata]XP_051137214.1 pentatricopeptide repeat-containing protein At2g48000-like [Andrographis paniculata]
MAAAGSRVTLPILRAKNTYVITESRRRFAWILSRRGSSSSSSESDVCLLQKLLKVPLSGIKATLDSELGGESTEFPWAALLTALSTSAPQKANLVIEWKLEKLTKGNNQNQESYAQLIFLCEKIRNLPIALLIFTSMEAQGVAPTTSVFNALVSASLSSGNLLTALSLFEIMKNSEGYQPDADTYNHFISAYANMGNKNAVEDWVVTKESSGFPVDDVQTYGFLIRCCIKSKNFEDSERYYNEILLAGLMPNESIFHDMLLMFCQKKRFNEVKDILKFLRHSRWKIDCSIVKKVVNLYSEFGQIDMLEELLVILSESNQMSEVLSVVHCSILRVYARKDRLDDVEYSVGRMLKQGISFTSAKDVEEIICSYFRMEAYDRLDLFLERIRESYELTRSIYDLLGAGYRRVGLLEKYNMLVNEMKVAGFA